MTGLSLKPQGLSREFIRIGQAAATESAQIEAGLRLTNILGAQERMIGFVDEEPWHRGGGETYVADSLVLVSGIEDLHRHVLAKAFVSIGTPLDAKLDSLLRRRKLVSEMGIPVPRLYSAREATIFEEFIDFPVIAAELVDEAVLEQIGEIGAPAIRTSQARRQAAPYCYAFSLGFWEGERQVLATGVLPDG